VSDQANRVFTTEFKERAVLRLEAGEPATTLAAELGVRRKLLYDWAKAYREHGVAGFNRKRGPKPGGRRLSPPPERTAPADPLAQAEARVAELERLVGRQQVDLDFFRRALRLTDADSPSGTAPISSRSSKQ
jgi:transposase-like protein